MSYMSPNFASANGHRQLAGAKWQVEAVRVALRVLGGKTPKGWLEAANTRLGYPNDSLAQLGARLGITKDAFAGRLARLLKKAEGKKIRP